MRTQQDCELQFRDHFLKSTLVAGYKSKTVLEIGVQWKLILRSETGMRERDQSLETE